MKRDAQSVLLLLVGGTLIKIGVNGTYVRYVRVGLRPWLLLAGATLVGLAVMTLWQVLRPRAAPAAGPREPAAGPPEPAAGPPESAAAGPPEILDDSGAPGPQNHPRSARRRRRVAEEAPDDERTYGQPRSGWLLLAPALALLLLAPPAVGAFQAGRDGTVLPAASGKAGKDFAALPTGDPVRLSVLDYAARAASDQGRSLAGRRVKLTGFIIPGPGGQPYLARMVVTCCAAGARPVKVGLTGLIPADLVQTQWIEVVGGYTARTDRDPVNGGVVPYLQVSSTREIPAPEQQYES